MPAQPLGRAEYTENEDPCDMVLSMLHGRLIASLTVGFAALVLPAVAIAGEGGEGLYGKTNDKVITNFGYGLMAFFVLLVVGLSVLQHLLERRKTRK